MMRYIDADLLKAVLVMSDKTGKMKCVDMRKVIESIDGVPTADVVEVVKCKDCKYWKELLPVCERIHRAGWGVNDFCSFGEREEK